ncbi:hypothetical protein PINS_up008407 [Pythium insidiosum]|nr:hypothetical protein PINS_up008407 [Pythium insidiosum]
MDWKSLAQVMEVGVLLQDLSASDAANTQEPTTTTPSRILMKDIQRLYDVWWSWSDTHRQIQSTLYFSERFQAQLLVPSWSTHVRVEDRIPDPFVSENLFAIGNITSPIQVSFATPNPLTNVSASDPVKPAHVFVAAAPIEATAGRSRSFDEDALVFTIRSARKRVSVSVMDFVPYSMYTLKPPASNGPIWWPALTNALLASVFTKPGFRARLLISEWQHSRKEMYESLRILRQQAAICRQLGASTRCSGELEIRVFRVPGWQNTTSTSEKPALWPSFTRVNHAKYIVSDTHVNIGTSNMEWGYFYTTAGISVNTDHEPTRQAVERIFERNWASDYASPLE